MNESHPSPGPTGIQADLERAARYLASNNDADGCISGAEADRIAGVLLVLAGRAGEAAPTPAPTLPDEQINRSFALAYPPDTTPMQQRRVIARALLASATGQATPAPSVEGLTALLLTAMEWGRDYWTSFSMRGDSQREVAEQIADKWLAAQRLTAPIPAPSVAALPQWISVDEQLPPVRVRVLIGRFGGTPPHERTLAVYDPERYTPPWRYDDDWSESIRDVTHWMPLPAPPGQQKVKT